MSTWSLDLKPLLAVRGCMLTLGVTIRAYNNMCYLIEKYAPIEGIDKYDSRIDPSLTGACIVPHLDDGLI